MPAVAEALHSEIVDVTSMWGVHLRENDELVRCKVVFRCAVLRGGAEVWVAGCYTPQSRCDGSWTSKETRCAVNHAQECAPSKQLLRKRGAKSRDAVGHQTPAGQVEVPAPVPGLNPDWCEDAVDADSLLEQLHATSTDELMCMLDEESDPSGCGDI